MRRQVMTAAVAVMTLALGPACDGPVDDDNGKAPVRVLDDDELRRQGRLLLGDSFVVAALVTPQTPGHIVYDPPVDLSYATAQRMRPDLTRGDTTRRDTSRTATRRDTTGGDATVDTSGGASRPRRP